MSEDVTKWLEERGLGKYAHAFIENDATIGELPLLTDDDLREIGLPVGARRRFLAAVSETAPAKESPTPTPQSEQTSSTGEAERRQLTVMFCDLVGSTILSQRLDPEDLRELNRLYQDACKAAIERYDGYVARYMGDGVLAYFGYPQAHEDDAERAIHAALGVVESVAGLSPCVGDGADVDLAVRVGIATGPVVVGDLIGEGASQENAVVGETPNLAARLQGLADENTVVIGPGTYELTVERFECRNLGAHSLKGIAESINAWRVVAPIAAESRFEAAHRTGVTPLVGREHEIGLLLERWAQAKEGDGQVVLLSGEAGIGKSRITEILRERATGDDPVRLRYQCSPYHTNTALHPVIEQLRRASQFEAEDTDEVKLAKLETLLARGTVDPAAVAPLFAPLLSIPTNGRYPPLEMTPERQKEGTLQALVAQMDGLSHEQPVLFIFEDVHWADPTSLELLGITIERTQDLPALVVITFRPEFTAPWTGYTHVTSLTLNRFTRSLVATMVNKVTTGKPLPDKVLAQIVEKTDGVPLFVEELTKTTLESGLLTEEADKYVLSGPLPEVAIPTTLHDSLLARLDRLGTVKEVAQTASAIGREFDHELLAALSPLSVDELHEALDQLINAGLIFPRGRSTKTIYSFKHALVQDAAYESLLRSTRQTLHGRIAETIRATFPDVVSAQPELLAHHFTEARRSSEAIEWWLRAGQQAAERSAIQETVAHLSRGLVVLGRLPQSTERDRRELAFQIALGGPLMTTRGWGAPDTAKTFKRARELCEQLGDTKELLPALYGEWIQTITGGDISAGQDAAIELLRLSEEQGDSAGIVNAHRCLCFCSLLSGNLASAGRYIEEGLKVYDPKEHRSLGYRFAHDPLVSLLSQRALIESLTGYGERALETCTEAIGYATELAHLPSRIFATWISGALSAAIRRDIESAERHSREILSLSKELNIPTWRAWGSVAEPRRVYRRLQLLRGLEHEQIKSIFPRG